MSKISLLCCPNEELVLLGEVECLWVIKAATRRLYWNCSSRIKQCTTGGSGAVLTQTFNARKASSSCPSRLLLYVQVFFPVSSRGLVGSFILSSLPGRLQEVEKTSLQISVPFLLCPAGKGVPPLLVGGDSLLLQASTFLLSLWVPCAVLCCFFPPPSNYCSHDPWVSKRGWNPNVRALQKMGLLKLSHPALLTPLGGNSWFTDAGVTAAGSLDLRTWLRDAPSVLGRQLNWSNCWQTARKGCLSAGVFEFSKGGCWVEWGCS